MDLFSNTRYCGADAGDDSEILDEVECDEQRMVSLVAAVLYNTESDVNWLQNLRNQLPQQ